MKAKPDPPKSCRTFLSEGTTATACKQQDLPYTCEGTSTILQTKQRQLGKSDENESEKQTCIRNERK